MAKIVITAFLFLAMVAMASAYTTITTTVVEEDSTGGRYGSGHEMCQQQFMEQQELQQCQMYLQKARTYGEESIEMVARRPMLQDEQLKMQCCKQLENMNEECRCQGIWQMVREQQQAGGRRQMGQMTKMAMELPRMCNMEPFQCQF